MAHEFLDLVLWNAQQTYSLGAWRIDVQGLLVHEEDIPLPDTFIPAIGTSESLLAIGYSGITLFEATGDGLSRVSFTEVPREGIHSILIKDRLLFTVGMNGLKAYDLASLDSPILLESWRNRTQLWDGAVEGHNLLLVDDFGIFVVGWDVGRAPLALAQFWGFAVGLGAASGVLLMTLWRRSHVRRGIRVATEEAGNEQ